MDGDEGWKGPRGKKGNTREEKGSGQYPRPTTPNRPNWKRKKKSSRLIGVAGLSTVLKWYGGSGGVGKVVQTRKGP